MTYMPSIVFSNKHQLKYHYRDASIYRCNPDTVALTDTRVRKSKQQTFSSSFDGKRKSQGEKKKWNKKHFYLFISSCWGRRHAPSVSARQHSFGKRRDVARGITTDKSEQYYVGERGEVGGGREEKLPDSSLARSSRLHLWAATAA